MSDTPLALEGLKKVEAAQQELFDAFSACYTKVNGRAVDTFQPHEMIMLCNDACFFDLIDKIREEIEQLSGEKTEPIADLSGVATLAEARGLHLEVPQDVPDIKEALAEPVYRTMFLGELLADLQASRLAARRLCMEELSLILTDQAEMEAKPLIEEMGQAFGIKASGSKGGAYAGKGGKGAYKGKGAAASGGSDSDPKAQALEQIAEAVAADTELCQSWPEHLLYPEWNLSQSQDSMVKNLMDMFNKEYTTRRSVLARRLDVTIQAFLWSPKADEHIVQMSQAIASVMEWRDKLSAANIGLWHVLFADQNTSEDKGKVSSVFSLQSVVKTIVIGAVPDRGGVPEGYTVEDITKDVVKANVSLQMKDLGRGKGASAQAAAAMASKKWVGRGIGAGDDKGGGGGGGEKGGGGGGYYQKGGGGKKGGGKDSGGGGYYGGGGKGGGGGYYAQQNSSDSGGGGGGYYGSQGGDSQGGGGGGGGFYASQGGGKSGGGKGGGDKGGKSSKGGDKGSGGGGGGGGGFYAQQQASDGGGGGGGFYAQQQNAGGGGGFYAQQQAGGGGGGGGGGGFYAQQQDSAGGGSGGGFYAQQQNAGGGGGFYAQQQPASGGFYAQQGGGGGGGGFSAQQGGADGGGGGFYAQQAAGGGGGFYAQQQQQSAWGGGGGGGFYDQGGGGGGKGGGRGRGGGGGGFGGRDADLPPTAKGWSKGGR